MRLEFQRLSFVVVEDNAYMRRIIRTLLNGFGSREVYDAEDGAAGLEAFVSYKPDIVITDWEMPVLDGIELTRYIRNPETSANPFTPVIMVTAYSEKRRVMLARDVGVTEYLAKPISAKILYERILSLVASPRPFIKSRHYFGPDRRRGAGLSPPEEERRLGVPGEIVSPDAVAKRNRDFLP